MLHTTLNFRRNITNAFINTGNGNMIILNTILPKLGNINNIKNSYNQTLLHIATNNNKNDIVKLLLNRYNMIDNKRDLDGNTSLHIAIKNKNLYLVKLLVHNYNINIRNNNGMTPLLYSFIIDDYIIKMYLIRRSLTYRQTSINTSPINIRTRLTTSEIKKIFIIPEHILNKHIEMLVQLKESCPICLDDFVNEKIIITNCHHFLCLNCFEKIDKCPICRQML